MNQHQLAGTRPSTPRDGKLVLRRKSYAACEKFLPSQAKPFCEGKLSRSVRMFLLLKSQSLFAEANQDRVSTSDDR